MDKIIPFLTSLDLSLPTYLLTWLSCGLAFVLLGKTSQDPANACVGCWCARFRRWGIMGMQGSLAAAIIFGEELKWAPWPPMLPLLIGLNLYYGASIMAVQERIAAWRSRDLALSTR